MRIPPFAEPLTRRQFQILLMPPLFACLFSGCSEKRETSGQVSVVWPEFERFEPLLLEAIGLIESGKTSEVLLRRGRLLEAGWAVNLQTLPPVANDCETLRRLLGDLVNKLNRLAVPEIDHATMSEVIIGMKPIVGEIGRASHIRRS